MPKYTSKIRLRVPASSLRWTQSIEWFMFVEEPILLTQPQNLTIGNSHELSIVRFVEGGRHPYVFSETHSESNNFNVSNDGTILYVGPDNFTGNTPYTLSVTATDTSGKNAVHSVMIYTPADFSWNSNINPTNIGNLVGMEGNNINIDISEFHTGTPIRQDRNMLYSIRNTIIDRGAQYTPSSVPVTLNSTSGEITYTMPDPIEFAAMRLDIRVQDDIGRYIDGTYFIYSDIGYDSIPTWEISRNTVTTLELQDYVRSGRMDNKLRYQIVPSSDPNGLFDIIEDADSKLGINNILRVGARGSLASVDNGTVQIRAWDPVYAERSVNISINYVFV